MITENLSTLKIHKLTQSQYDRELAAGRIDDNALYLTPSEDSESVTIVQTTGNSETAVMSQKAVTDILLYPSTQLLDVNNVGIFEGYFDGTTFHSGETWKTLYIPCKSNTLYCFKRAVIDNKFVVGFSPDIPTNNGVGYGLDNSNGDFVALISRADSNYLCVYYYNKNISGTLTESELLQNIKIYEDGIPSDDNEPFVADIGNENRKIIDNAVRSIPMTKFVVGKNRLTTDIAMTATNWTVADTDGLTITHIAGNAEPLQFNLGETVAGEIWLITFNSTNINDDLVYLSFGDEAKTQTYNGTNTFAVAIRVKANGDKLKITPESRFAGTITNLQARVIAKEGTELYEFDGDVITNLDNLKLKTGFWNVVLGTDSTFTNAINSSRCIAIGHNALHSLISGNRNIGIGTFAMQQMNDGEDNISFGADSMGYVDRLKRCTAVGVKAMVGYTDSIVDSTAIGTGAGFQGNQVTAIGSMAGCTNKGDDNTFIGCHAGANNTTGSRNIIIGSYTEGQPAGMFNVIIGRNANYPNNANNVIAIGKNAVATKSNQVVIGSAEIEEVVLGNKKLIFNDDGTVTWVAV